MQVPPTVLATDLAPVWTGPQRLTPIHRMPANGGQELLAEGFERREPLPPAVADAPRHGTERRLVLRSHPRAQAGARVLRARLAKAHAAMAAVNARRRGQRRGPARPALQEAVAALVARDHVQGWLSWRYAEQRRQWPVRRQGDRPAIVIRLLSVGLRVLTRLEFVVRRRLAAEQTELVGL